MEGRGSLGFLLNIFLFVCSLCFMSSGFGFTFQRGLTMLGCCDNKLMDTGQAQGSLRKEAVLEVCEVLLWLVFFFGGVGVGGRAFR